MKPGDKNPARYNNSKALSAAILAMIALSASAPTIYKQFLVEREGNSFSAYQDGQGLWTICGGLTRIYGRPVRSDDELTQEVCDQLDAEEQARGLAEMRGLVRPEIWEGMSPAAQAGTASFCVHNLGAGKCWGSTFLRLLNEGRRNEACAQITRWIFDGGKDCRIRSNNCYGQTERRPQEDELCMQGAI